MASKTASNSIISFLTAPSKVANSLDWRKCSGSVLSMSVSKNHIDLAIASHPESDEPVHSLPSIPLKKHTVNNKKVLDASVTEELSNVLKNFNVCGMIVNWPVQSEGWCGASCGRVLHTLDQIANNGKNILSHSTPICLYDVNQNLPYEDEWGRDPVYSKPSDKTIHIASKEQYGDAGLAAVEVWNDFCRNYWPEFAEQQQHWNDTLAKEFSDENSGDEFTSTTWLKENKSDLHHAA